MKYIRVFVSENFQFLEVKFSIYLNRRVFVMYLLLLLLLLDLNHFLCYRQISRSDFVFRMKKLSLFSYLKCAQGRF